MGKQSGQQDRYSHCIKEDKTAVGRLRTVGYSSARLLLWGLMAGIASVLSVVSQSIPAQAEELTDWNYDSQTRSLNVILPNSVAPTVSILAPDQLLLELPDTQIGDVAGQTVGDGVVESVVLEQTTPETVWMVVEFAEGTVLADQQTVTPTDLAGETMQQWQVKPALMASSRTVEVPVAADPADINPAATNSVATSAPPADETIDEWTNSPADSLRTPAVDVAQSPDFSDLPVLQPAMSVDESVSVPPIDALPSAGASESIPIPVEPAPAAAIPVPAVPAQMEANQTDGMTTEADALPEEVPVASESKPFESEQPVASSGDSWNDGAADETLPAEPPFIGEVAAEAEVAASDELADEEPLPERIAEVPTFEGESFEADPTAEEAFESEAFDPAPVAGTPVAPGPSANSARWPEPLPFGQPLP